jgi:hypothetical protein
MALGLRGLVREATPGGSLGYQEPQIVPQTAYGPVEQELPSELLELLGRTQRPSVRELPFLLGYEPPRQTDYSLAGISGINLGGGRNVVRGGDGAPASGLPGFSPGAGANAQTAREIARWIENRAPGNFQVSGLEGFQGTGQISTGHVTNSQHYTGEAGDVSYLGGGRWGAEPAALDWLYAKLQQKYGPALTELLWRVKDHYDHLHYGVRRGG